PTTGLDPNQIVEIRALIKQLGQAKTVIFSTHILGEVEAVCDRILIINHGRIVADSPPGALRTQSQGERIIFARIADGVRDEVLAALATLPQVAAVAPVNGTPDAYELRGNAGADPAREVFHLCVARSWTLTELRPVETRLEDIFRDLTLN
ncbi:MAG TPA: gliding motility-associated ABC transporter ATP-binding subunit GldA, partial [Flavobacteriales bacterium]|nr:gliding motility-associated ABC transporter ATP-binding subunit GldA [Flavobacteriales bacterium]